MDGAGPAWGPSCGGTALLTLKYFFRAHLPASYVITDLTQLRKIKSMERAQGVSITRELLWWWGMRQATVQQLLDLLCHLELYRAAQIILNCESPQSPHSQQELRFLALKAFLILKTFLTTQVRN